MNRFYHKLFINLKRPVLSTVTLALVFFIIYVDGVISNFCLQSWSDRIKTNPVFDKERFKWKIKPKSMISATQLHFVEEENAVMTHEVHGVEFQDSMLLPPVNVTEEQRIDWFRKRLHRFEIFKADSLSDEFHERVAEFLGKDCEIQFFMTWISPISSFGRRQMLALNSLFQAHRQGCLIILSGALDSLEGKRILKPLTDRGFKVEAVKPNMQFLLKNTPAEAWFDEMRSGNKDPVEIPLPQNLSNLIRLAVLYKYGGVYLDTDLIVLKSFKGLKNSIGAQSVDPVSRNWTRLNNAVLVFDKEHPILFKFMQEFALTFNGSKWGHNGPYLVSRVVQRVAARPEFRNIRVMPPMAFYPVDWSRISSFFMKPRDRITSKWIKAKLLQLSGETYGVHLWNKQSSNLRIEEGSIVHKLLSDHGVICRNMFDS